VWVWSRNLNNWGCLCPSSVVAPQKKTRVL